MNNQLMRKYEPIWIRLKETGVCAITAPKSLHSRIVRMVSKEKYYDYGYKLLLQEVGKRAKINYTVRYSVITFNLVKSIGTDDL